MGIEEFQLEFTVLPASSERGKDKLFDNQGYSFSQEKKSRAGTKRWRCIQKCCKCIVLEDIATGKFSQLRTHNHPMKPGNLKNAQIVTKVKTQAAQDLFKGGKHIVDEVLRQELPEGEPVRGVSNPSNMARQANRLIQANRKAARHVRIVE